MIRNVYYQIGRQTYDAKRITLYLNSIGMKCSVKKVRRYLKIADLKPINEPIKRKQNGPKEYLKGKYERLFKYPFRTRYPNQVWVVDITEKHYDNNIYYLCTFKDIFTKKAVGWAVNQMRGFQLVEAAFFNAINHNLTENILKELIIHSDNGTEFKGYQYNRMLKYAGCQISMSWIGRSKDNPHIESLWNIYKKEVLDKSEYTFDEFKYQTNLYFNWYNLERLRI
ncbi:DDE-type integrase/transposase/recombinase [Spiroplasma sp. SV19]|uniref:DDE-type integrase/transposase/recombinase n=1 Tax=Spiroplasma sp. SV19 TaxID=2570468 RepID=UPI0024B839AB|nr:DDE-type integrase/transposase/recombinase [Spiroplasma sp. SV19]WHQ36951.1 DDE-type integrase/transposase/recombinase [Spiroplasma sp. SV19]